MSALTSSTLVVIGAKRLSLEEPLSEEPSGRGFTAGMFKYISVILFVQKMYSQLKSVTGGRVTFIPILL